MRSFIIAGAVLVGSFIGASAADAPNVIGSWTRTDVTMVLSKGKSSKPLFINRDSDQVWKLNIEAQEKGAFSGTLTGSIPKSQTIVGAFQADGKQFVFSTAAESGSGEVNGDEMQYCWTNQRAVLAGCSIFKRDK
jgi:hypothetical protein